MTKPRIAVIGNPGKWSTEVLADAIEHRTGFRLVTQLSAMELDLNQSVLRSESHNLCDLDGIIIRKVGANFGPVSLEHLEMLRVAEHAGVRIFNSPNALIRLLDRLTCSVTLHNHHIPLPPTLVTESIDIAIKQVRLWDKAVLKPLFSTKARGMQVLSSSQSDKVLQTQLTRYKTRHPLLYLQKFVELNGEDMGLIFINNSYQGAYSRIAGNKAWNTTVNSGGRYGPSSPNQEMVEIAQRAQAAFELDYAIVDMAQTQKGPVVFEVSALGGFKGAAIGSGINLAERLSDFAINSLKE